MAIYKNATGCAVIAGGDPFSDAKFDVLNPDDDQGIDIEYNGEQQGYTFSS